MGILNITPDSFSDGGRFLSRDHAVGHALQMLEDGADLLDLGGESTRPGAKVVQSGISAEEELRRIMPVLEDILRERPDAVISVDTYKAEVARAAINAGAEIVNDVSGMRWDNQMPATVAELKCGLVLMHTRGKPELMELGFPLLAGVSRKSFIGRTLARDGKDAPPEMRTYGTLAAVTISVLKGAHVVRVHDAKQAAEAVKIADEIAKAM